MSEHRLCRELGQVIQRQRQRAGISQEDLAKEAYLSRTYLSDIERGLRNISISSLAQIAKALTTTASQLLIEAEQLEGGTQSIINAESGLPSENSVNDPGAVLACETV